MFEDDSYKNMFTKTKSLMIHRFIEEHNYSNLQSLQNLALKITQNFLS